MDAELQALNDANAAAAAHNLQVTLLDQIDGVWNAGASDGLWSDPIVNGTGADRTAALKALTAALESR
jgi:poly(3-hydroxybutyrate) depolymerase